MSLNINDTLVDALTDNDWICKPNSETLVDTLALSASTFEFDSDVLADALSD
ncbi:hypothetical protein HIR68_06615 [Staphylococcus coagulans]|uniref:hypothetical protein n=1 Tax=Staphylococcus coagulans TaxID=74706 RepID=UPI001BEA6CC2|nr:hypothetical protein [Staphylococcus coagulans]